MFFVVTHVLVRRGRLQREKQLSLLKTLTLPTFSKLAATLPKKIIGCQNHFWQLAQAELVEFIPDKKSLAAKTNFGRILPKIFGTANFYFDFFSAFHFVLQRVTFKLNKRQHTRTTHHTTHTAPSTTNTISLKNKCNHRPPSQQSTGEKLTGPPYTI